MKKVYLALVTVISLFITGCTGSMRGVVIDAETMAPIAGALIHAEWFVTRGFGLSYRESYATREAETDKDGRFSLYGVLLLSPSVDPPEVIIYKKGYIVWHYKYFYQSPEVEEYKPRTNFQWGGDQAFEMERFKKTYAHTGNYDLVTGRGSLTLSDKFKEALEWEREAADKERELVYEKTKMKPTNNRINIWREVVKELYCKDRSK